MIRFLITCSFYVSAGMLFLCSCSREDSTIGQDLVNSSLRQIVIDTCTVSMSTVFFDSTLTSGKSTILTGYYNDNVFGPTKAISYVSFTSPTSSVSDPTTAVFDSMSLRIKHNKYYCGDTLQFQDLDIYTLTQNVALYDDGYLFNTTRFNMMEDPVGSKTFRPKSGSSGEVFIRLNDAYGRHFFSKICGGSDTIYSSDKFVKYFKGFAIAPGAGSKSVLGYISDSTYIRFYYHQRYDVESTFALDIPVIKSLQFNQVEQDRTGTLLAPFNRKNREIHSSKLNNQGFMQPINAFYPVLEFPYISQLLKLSSYGSIAKATLELYPVKGTYGPTNPLPPGLTLYITDVLNSPQGTLTEATSTSSQDGDLTIDELYNIDTKYTFDLKSFLTSEITAIGVNKHKLQIALANTETGNNLESLVLGDQHHPKYQIKLKIIYVIYDTK